MRLTELSQKSTKPVAMKNREPLIYVERSKISVKNNNVVAFSKGSFDEQPNTTILPVASVGCLLVGPGCSITNEAVKIISKRECCLMFTGGGGVPVYSYSGNYKTSKNALKQIAVLFNPEKRLGAVKALLKKRNSFLLESDLKLHPEEVDACESVQQCFLVEARWAKRFYANVNSEFGIKTKNEIQKLTNFFCYALVMPVIINMGFNPNVGLMHGVNRGGGLVFDIADLIKSTCSVKVAAYAKANNLTPNETKYMVLKTFKDKNYQNKLIKVIQELYELGD